MSDWDMVLGTLGVVLMVYAIGKYGNILLERWRTLDDDQRLGLVQWSSGHGSFDLCHCTVR